MSVDTLFTQDGLSFVNNDTAISPATALETSRASKMSKTAPPNARRPTTRSQTGTIAKRPTRDDDYIPESKKRVPLARKRRKTTSNSPEALDSGSSHTHQSASPMPPSTREASLCSTSSTPLLPSNQKAQLTFYHSSMSETDQPNRLPRSRASLPTPIPNLTKKSRGRRVPTQVSTDPDLNQNDTRLYVCSVEGCGKCFHRGEHLKRHIRSIHTHEKPFKCTFPLCEKYFNRHDNLLQHLKVHRQANSLSDESPPHQKGSSQDDPHTELTLSAPTTRRKGGSQLPHSHAEEEEDDEPASPASPPARPRTIYDAYPPRYGSHPATSSTSSVPQTIYSHFNKSEKPDNVMDGVVMHGDTSSSEAMNILTNAAVSRLRMEVSSLRTEQPRSPVDMRTMVGTMQMNPC